MTNADKIRSMTDEELTQFLFEIQKNGGFEVNGYCNEVCPHKEECEAAEECIDWEEPNDIRWWLAKECDE